MHVKLFAFALTSFLLSSACGEAAGDGSEDIVEETTGGNTGAEAESGTPTGDNASPVDNSAVTDRPLLKSCYRGDTFSCTVEATIVSETNIIRGSLGSLAHAFETSFVARDWSMAQAEASNISHDGFPYERRKVLLAEFPNAKWGFNAENVAMMTVRESDPVKLGKAFAEMWKNSPGHYKNMIGNYKYLGVGVYKIGNSVYATQLFH